MIYVMFALHSALSFWVVFMDGAEVVEGWRSFFLFDWLAATLTAEELRFYVAISWLVSLAVFLFQVFGGT